MNILDYLIILVVLLSLSLGAFRGIVRELLGLGGWIGALVVAWLVAPMLAPLLPDWTGVSSIRWLLAFIILFIMVRLLAWGIGLVAKELVAAAHLGTLDRGLGSVFGLLRGFAIVLACAVLAHMTQLPKTPLWQNAFSGDYLSLGVKSVSRLLPSNIHSLLIF